MRKSSVKNVHALLMAYRRVGKLLGYVCVHFLTHHALERAEQQLRTDDTGARDRALDGLELPNEVGLELANSFDSGSS